MTDAIVLAIECTQREGGVALRDGAGAVHVEALAASKRHDDDLLPAVDRLLRRGGVERDRLGAVAVSIGPGGFTGLRIAISTVKMLAMALSVRVVAVPTALVVAESAAPGDVGDGPIIVALASKRETFWATTLVRAGGAWLLDGPGALADSERADLGAVRALLGDRYLPAAVRARCAALGVPVIEPRFDPSACLRAAARMLDAGHTCDPLALLPIYPRPPEAVTIWEARERS
jgi:tRNA threonylcarbamoyladenosine biosynthesis protein TsaB